MDFFLAKITNYTVTDGDETSETGAVIYSAEQGLAVRLGYWSTHCSPRREALVLARGALRRVAERSRHQKSVSFSSRRHFVDTSREVH